MSKTLASLILFLCGLAAQAQNVVITGTDATYANGTVTAAFVSQGGHGPTKRINTVPVDSSGHFSLAAWNNGDSDYTPSTTTFQICTTKPVTCYTAPTLRITSSRDISSYLAGAPSPSLNGSQPFVTPEGYGAYGGAQLVTNGCNTTALSTSVMCPTGTFVSSDVGKNIWFSAAGVSGGALGTTITAVGSSTNITVAASPSATISNTRTVYGHDDDAALQGCFNYSGSNGVQCVLDTSLGYLVGSAGLTIPAHLNATGNSYTQQTSLFGEYNGDIISLQPGPITGVNIANLEINVDPSQPRGQGIHLNAAIGGGYSYGGLFNSNLTNIQVENMANECIWFDGGGGNGYTYNLPNQYVNLYQFNCNGPIQQHNANMILMTGQNAQILFLGGAVNGVVQLQPTRLS